jgi:Domain of unknown function (DUF397)
MESLNWRKASYSAANGGGCVEVVGRSDRVLVRDTQDRTGPVLKFSAGAWRRFAAQVKRSLAPAFAGPRCCSSLARPACGWGVGAAAPISVCAGVPVR